MPATDASRLRDCCCRRRLHAPALAELRYRRAETYAVRRLAVGDEPSLRDAAPHGRVGGAIGQPEALGDVVNRHPSYGVPAGDPHHIVAHGAGSALGILDRRAHAPEAMTASAKSSVTALAKPPPGP